MLGPLFGQFRVSAFPGYTASRFGPRYCGQSAAKYGKVENGETKTKMHIMKRKLLLKAVLKGKNIRGIRPFNHPYKKKKYECVDGSKSDRVIAENQPLAAVKLEIKRLFWDTG
ncbi:MAG: hypothetical protein VYE44_00600 [Verrucomicrobiota bacterium]|nr:hypothetical protein [Verrucomicrobiota bacterium]